MIEPTKNDTTAVTEPSADTQKKDSGENGENDLSKKAATSTFVDFNKLNEVFKTNN